MHLDRVLCQLILSQRKKSLSTHAPGIFVVDSCTNNHFTEHRELVEASLRLSRTIRSRHDMKPQDRLSQKDPLHHRSLTFKHSTLRLQCRHINALNSEKRKRSSREDVASRKRIFHGAVQDISQTMILVFKCAGVISGTRFRIIIKPFKDQIDCSK